MEVLTWSRAIDRYLRRLLHRGLSVSTRRHAVRSLWLLARFLAARGHAEPASASVQDLAAFLVFARGRRVRWGRRRGLAVTDSTVRVWCQSVRGFFRWLVREGLLLLDPTVALGPIPLRQKLPRVLTPAQVERLLAAPSGEDPISRRDRALLELAYSSALRAGELLGLDLLDLDLAQGELTVRRGKGGKGRRLPVGEPAVKAVLAYLTDGRDDLIPQWRRPRPTAVFLSRVGTRLRSDLLGRALALRARQAGIEGHVTMHTLRHSAAVHMLKRGADIRSLAQLLGHASVETTARYTRLVLDDLKETLARAHPRSRWAV